MLPVRKEQCNNKYKKGHNLKAHVAYLISNHHTNKGLDPNIHVTDGIYNIKGRSTLKILVANYAKNYVTFTKVSA